MILSDEIKLTINDCGHTEAMHIKIDDKTLIDRLLHPEPIWTEYGLSLAGKCKTISSRFLDSVDVCEIITTAIKQNRDIMQEWIKYRYDKRITISYKSLTPIGHGYAKNTSFKQPYKLYDCIVVLQLGYNGSEFSIETAYPVPNATIERKIQNDRREFVSKKKTVAKKHPQIRTWRR